MKQSYVFFLLPLAIGIAVFSILSECLFLFTHPSDRLMPITSSGTQYLINRGHIPMAIAGFNFLAKQKMAHVISYYQAQGYDFLDYSFFPAIPPLPNDPKLRESLQAFLKKTDISALQSKDFTSWAGILFELGSIFYDHGYKDHAANYWKLVIIFDPASSDFQLDNINSQVYDNLLNECVIKTKSSQMCNYFHIKNPSYHIQ